MHHLPGVFVRANVTPSLLFHSIAYSFIFLFFCFFYIFVFHSFCWLYHFSTITSLNWCNAYSFNAHLEVCVSLSLCVCLRAMLETINPLALYFPVFFCRWNNRWHWKSHDFRLPWKCDFGSISCVIWNFGQRFVCLNIKCERIKKKRGELKIKALLLQGNFSI